MLADDRVVIGGLRLGYTIAAGGVSVRAIWATEPGDMLVALTLLLFLLDGARMAIVDLHKYWQVKTRQPAASLRPFLYPVIGAIASELIGFYLAWVWLGVGMAVLLAGQLAFNLTVPIALYPDRSPHIRPWPRSDRVSVIVADAIALAVVGAWIATGFLWCAVTLLVMMVVYLSAKYVPLLTRSATSS